MPLIYVDTLDDPRLDAFARLTEAQLRSKLEPERALFIAESQKVIERAFEGGMEPISLLMEEKWLPSMAPLIERMEEQARERTDGEGLPVFVAPHDELEKLTGFELTRGALGAFRRPALPTVADVLHEARLVAVLDTWAPTSLPAFQAVWPPRALASPSSCGTAPTHSSPGSRSATGHWLASYWFSRQWA